MRIALLTSQVPFVRGGAELLAESLKGQLQGEGHEVELVAVPLNWHPTGKLMDSLLAGSLIDLDELGGLHVDLAIGLKFPGYLARHANKRFWIIHQHRQAYDHWESGSSDLLHQADGVLAKGAIEAADREAFAGRAVYTISRNVTDRLQRFLGIDSRPIYHPPPLAPFLRPGRGGGGDHLLVPSRLGAAKRQDLVLEALALCREPVRLVFVGKADEPAFETALRRRTEQLGLAERVEWLSGLAVADLAGLYGTARGVVFAPIDEDYGYVTLEAMLSAKPVITTRDAGGPLEFIRDGREGLVCAPTAQALADAMDRLWSEPGLAQELGGAALQRYHELEIGWPQVLDQLLDRPIRRPARGAAPSSGVGEAPAAPADASQANRASQAASLAGQLAVDEAAILATLPVSSLDDVMNSFAIGQYANEEVRRYLGSHWVRYLETASLLPDEPGLNVLDLGAGKPHIFLGLVKLIDPHARFCAVVEAEHEAGGIERFPSTRGLADLVVETRAANLEVGRLPYADESFDLVLAMEVLEHLAINPAQMFAEAARVLKPGGSLIVTTPNIVSYRAFSLLQAGNSPYSFGVFVPYHGVYGRHNREYTPYEVELLGRMTGFETKVLRTRDVYHAEIDAFTPALPMLEGGSFPLALRGQNIFYLATKSGAREAGGSSTLYLEDPFAFVGTLRVEPGGDGVLSLIFRNDGRELWNGDTVGIQFHSYEPDGSRRSLAMDLPLAVPPDAERRLDLPVGPTKGHASDILAVELERRGRGWLNFVGVPRIQCVARAGAIEALRAAYPQAT